MTAEVLGNKVEALPWIPTDDTFGARLALIRQKMGWGNVKEAAIACALPTESWRTWERDGVSPRDIVRIAAKIADRTGVDYGWLLAGQRMAGVNRPNGPTGTSPAARVDTSGWNLLAAERSGPSAYPDRASARRPHDTRPGGHPKFPVLPPRPDQTGPTSRRPVPRRRAA